MILIIYCRPQQCCARLELIPPPRENITIYYAYFIGSLLTQDNIQLLKNQLNDNDSFILVECNKCFDDALFTKWSQQIMLKYIAIYHLNPNVDRLLRLDGDVIIDGNILEYYHSNLVDNVVALGIRECFNKQEERNARLALKDNLTINAGVCLINIRYWKNRLPTLNDFVKEFNNLCNRIFPAAEQNFLNIFFDGEKGYWPTDKYMRICLNYLVADSDYKDKKPVVFHYLGNNKPWKCDNMANHRLLFWKYGFKIYPKKYILNLLVKRIIYLIIHYWKAIIRRISFNN